MDLQAYLEQQGMSKYRLAQISGVPKTTIMDICAGRSEIGVCRQDDPAACQGARLYHGGHHGPRPCL